MSETVSLTINSPADLDHQYFKFPIYENCKRLKLQSTHSNFHIDLVERGTDTLLEGFSLKFWPDDTYPTAGGEVELSTTFAGMAAFHAKYSTASVAFWFRYNDGIGGLETLDKAGTPTGTIIEISVPTDPAGPYCTIGGQASLAMQPFGTLESFVIPLPTNASYMPYVKITLSDPGTEALIAAMPTFASPTNGCHEWNFMFDPYPADA